MFFRNRVARFLAIFLLSLFSFLHINTWTAPAYAQFNQGLSREELAEDLENIPLVAYQILLIEGEIEKASDQYRGAVVIDKLTPYTNNSGPTQFFKRKLRSLYEGKKIWKSTLVEMLKRYAYEENYDGYRTASPAKQKEIIQYFVQHQDPYNCLRHPGQCLPNGHFDGLEAAFLQPADFIDPRQISLSVARSLTHVGVKSSAQLNFLAIAKAAFPRLFKGIEAELSEGVSRNSTRSLKKYLQKQFPDVVKFGNNKNRNFTLHHIVEQKNIEVFGKEYIHNTHNAIALPQGKGEIHNAISAYYQKNFREYGGQSLRNYLKDKSYEEHVEYGMDVLINKFGLDLKLVESPKISNLRTWVVTNIDDVVEELPKIKQKYGLN